MPHSLPRSGCSEGPLAGYAPLTVVRFVLRDVLVDDRVSVTDWTGPKAAECEPVHLLPSLPSFLHLHRLDIELVQGRHPLLDGLHLVGGEVHAAIGHLKSGMSQLSL
jgi:hypothetical protein